MKIHIVSFLGVLMMVLAAGGPVRAKDVPFYECAVGDVQVRVISLVEKDLDAAILQGENDAQKAAVARAYPDGAIRNKLNVLLLRCGNVAALVDTGFDWTAGELDAALGEAGLTAKDVTHVIITHAHGDHTGGLVRNGKAAFPRAVILFPARELAFWSDSGRAGEVSAGMRRIFDGVSLIRSIYGERVRTFEAGETPCAELPGVQTVDAAGHMPGHVGIMVSAEGKTFFFWSDLLHAFDVQTADPSLSSAFDMDKAQAARSRAELLGRARAEGWLVVGSHVPFTQPRVLK